MSKELTNTPLCFIGHLKSPLKAKFGLPRQGAHAPSLPGEIILNTSFGKQEWWRDLENIEYLWLISWLHLFQREESSPTVRPPRLGGNKRVSTFATRSPARPNPIGLSLVKLEKILLGEGAQPTKILIRGHDLVDATPILDIKPYIPQADTPWTEVNNHDSWIGQAEHKIYTVSWPKEVTKKLQVDFHLCAEESCSLQKIIEELIKYDIRPRYKNKSDCDIRTYWFEYQDIDFEISYDDSSSRVVVCDIRRPRV